MSFAHKNVHLDHGFTKTISISSGKGGVGKTTIVSNLALQLAQEGNKVLILDGDLGMANVDIMFGVRPYYNVNDVFNGRKKLEEVIVPLRENISLIPGGSGIYELQNVSLFQKRLFLDQVNQLEGLYDYLLIDTAPGIAENVLYLNAAAHEIVLVLTPDPASLTDTYALIKVLNNKFRETKFTVICNSVRDEHEGLKVFKRLSDVCAKFLCVGLDYKGHIPLDQNLRLATKMQQLILEQNPRSPSSFGIKNIAKNINSFGHIGEVKGGIQFFWQQLVGVA